MKNTTTTRKLTKRAKTFERSRVIFLLEELLQYPDMLIDAVTNEYTNWDAESLLEFIEDHKKKRR